jgi:predicted amidophosphoribosyltransferase
MADSSDTCICPHCGMEIQDEDALLCLYCGESLDRKDVGFISGLKYSTPGVIMGVVVIVMVLIFIIYIMF